ncbi:alginate export family protein [Sulfurimonas sp. HSL-1716]|uniref:alginate export family protein n=1 Tax=Hydrocurvibacter sulfurireducens TaxID=3131937 RepID=UPI0031F7F5AE
MKRLLLSMAAVPLILGGLSVSASADGLNILSNVKAKGEIRARYENADVKDNNLDRAQAFTTRTTLGISADLLQVDGLSAYLEATSVNAFGYKNYNSTDNGKTQYDFIKDPQTARMTQGYVDYKMGKTLVRAGRQMVNLDNQRFIGAVGWRQMFQTFDAVAVVDNSIDNLSLLAAYVYGRNTILADTEATDTKSVLLHASYKVMPELTITAYDYMLSLHGYGSDTYGAALTGNIDAGMAKLNYRAEYAKQTDASIKYQENSTNYTGTTASTQAEYKNLYKADAQYYNLDLGANISGVLVGANYEYLSGKKIGEPAGGKTAFATPLATGHAFNGWADMFLSTPTGGLIDTNVRLGYKAKGFGKLLGVYHSFSADKDMAKTSGTTKDLGSEFDAVYVNKIPGVNNLTGMVKYASYNKGKATGYTHDKTVTWLMLDYKFATK